MVSHFEKWEIQFNNDALCDLIKESNSLYQEARYLESMTDYFELYPMIIGLNKFRWYDLYTLEKMYQRFQDIKNGEIISQSQYVRIWHFMKRWLNQSMVKIMKLSQDIFMDIIQMGHSLD